jgi:hypothetical protein
VDNREDEQFGRVSFRLKQESAVERAIAKVRHHLGSDWVMLTSEDIDELRWLLAEMWAHTSFMDWENVGLDSVTLESVAKLVEIAKAMQSESIKEQDGLARAREILGSV